VVRRTGLQQPRTGGCVICIIFHYWLFTPPLIESSSSTGPTGGLPAMIYHISGGDLHFSGGDFPPKIRSE